MSARLATLAATVALAAVAAAAAAPAEATVVSLRVESSSALLPLFNGTVSTEPHQVDGGDGSGPHACSGPPGAAPAPTATGALDDALRGAGISWRGKWDPSFRDFFIDRIGPYASSPPDNYWSLTVNGHFSAGGCLTRVDDGDSIRFFYGPLFGSGSPGESSGGGNATGGAGSGSAGGQAEAGPTRARLRRVVVAATRYLRREGDGEAWATLALAVRGGISPDRATAGLIPERLDSQLPDGSIGRDVNATALAAIALSRKRPRASARAAAWLAEIQQPSGGFGYRANAPPDVDTTGLASWALALAGQRAPLLRAGAFVRSAQSADGGFPALPGGTSNAQSTAFATIALRLSGIGPRHILAPSGHGSLDYLVSLSRRDGSIAYDRGSSPTPVWTTAQALLGLTTRTKLLDL